MANKVLRGPRRAATNRYQSLVVPADTESVLMQVSPFISVGAFVDTILAPEINAVRPGQHIARRQTALGRSIFLPLRTSTLISSAPSAVQAQAANLASYSEQSYSFYSTYGGDIWIVGNSAIALRHGGYDALERLGIRFLQPNPAWHIKSTRGSVDLDVNEIMSPTVRGFAWAPSGGLGSSSLPPGLPGRAAAAGYWDAFPQQTRNPSEILTGYSDGDEGFTGDRFQELDGDHSMLAWASTPGGFKRGPSESGVYPTGACASMPGTLAKLCTTHHGASGVGSYPAAPAGPSPWVGLAAAAWHESCSVNPPGGPITPDPGPDNATNPSPNYTAFGGLVALHAKHHVQSAAEKIVASGIKQPTTYAVSSEPNDGVYFCRCAHCVNLLRNGPYSAYLTALQKTQDSTDSDTLWHLVNEDQKYMQWAFQNALDANGNPFVPLSGVLGYVTHADPPSIPIHANTVNVVLISGGPTVGRLPSEMIPRWSAKQASNPWGKFVFGASTVWLTDRTTFSSPKWPSPKQAATLFADWISKGCTVYNSQTGASSLIQGLQLRIMSAQCWRPTLDVNAFIDEDFQLSYGPAATAVRALFDRWWYWFEWSPQSVAIGMAAMVTAQAALDAAPDPVSPDGRASVQRRLNHLKALIEWERRYTEYITALQDYDRGKLTLGGGATAAVTLSTVRLQPSVIRIEIEAGGLTFKWSKNADAATVVYEQTGVTIPAFASPYTLGTTGRVATFPTATYAVGQFWSEAPNVSPLLSAIDRCSEWAWRASSTNILQSSQYAGGVTSGRIYNSAPHPISNSSAGTTPPALTVLSQTAAGISPTPATSYVELKCTVGGSLGTAVLQYRVNGGAWTATSPATTPASSSTPVTLSLAGIVITCGAGTYNVNNLWYVTISPGRGNWDWLNAAAPASGTGWTTLVEPTTSDMNTLVASGVTAYPPLTGVTRRTFNETSFRPFNTSSATTLRDCPILQFPHKYVINTPGTTTIKLQTFGKSSTIVGTKVRVILSDMAGNLLQEWSFAPPLNPLSVTNDLVLTRPAGLYRLAVLDTPITISASRLRVPENVGCVLINDWLDAQACPVNGDNPTDHFWFCGPDPGETKIALVFGAGNFPIQFYDPTNTPVATTYSGPNQWTCNVGSYTNQAWSFTGFVAKDNQSVPYFENCPNRIAPSPYQLLIP